MATKGKRAKPTRNRGPKFVEKYEGTSECHIYRGDPDCIEIPPPGHFLHDPTAPAVPDPLLVEELFETGTMADPVEVWTDPDACVLYALDGRSRVLAGRIANDRRRKAKRDPIEFRLFPSPARTEKEAAARFRMLNYYRRVPTPSEMALDLDGLRRQGYIWEECARVLHVLPEGEKWSAERWGRRILPLAFCVREVREAFDAKLLPLSAAVRFGGRALDGSERLGEIEQRKLLAERLAGRDKGPKTRPSAALRMRGKVAEALSDGTKFKAVSGIAARAIAAYTHFLDGDETALDPWPDVARAARDVLGSKTGQSGQEADTPVAAEEKAS